MLARDSYRPRGRPGAHGHTIGDLCLRVINITKLERVYQAVSCAIAGYLSSSPVPPVLSEVSLFVI